MTAERAYREAAVHCASSAELTRMMCDMLLQDLQQAISAIKASDIEGRTQRIKHALDVLMYLQGFIDFSDGKVAARNFDVLYSILRAKILQAQMQQISNPLDEAIRLLQPITEAWRTVNSKQIANAIHSHQNGDEEEENEHYSAEWRA